MSSFEQELEQLSAGTVAALEPLIAAWESGEISTAELQTGAAELIAADTIAGHALGLAAFTGWLLAEFAGIPPASAIPDVPVDSDGVLKEQTAATRTITAGATETIRTRLSRLAGAEPAKAAQAALANAASTSKASAGYRHKVDAGGCELCRYVAGRTGTQRGTGRGFSVHPSCKCTPQPVRATE